MEDLRKFWQICLRINKNLSIIQLINLKAFWNNYSIISYKKINHFSGKVEISISKEIH